MRSLRKILLQFQVLATLLAVGIHPLWADEREAGAKTLLLPVYPLWLAQAGLFSSDQALKQKMTDQAIAGLAKQLPSDCNETRMRRDLCGIKPVRVPSSSMNPTVYVQETLGIQTVDFKPLKRGDLIVHKARFGGASVTSALTRLIGLPGETIEMRDGAVFVNGLEFTQKSENKGIDSEWGPLNLVRETTPEGATYEIALQDGNTSGIVQDFGPVTLPYDRYFVLGDNRGNSVDSRYPEQLNEDGMVAAKDIEGVAIVVLVSKSVDRVGAPLR